MLELLTLNDNPLEGPAHFPPKAKPALAFCRAPSKMQMAASLRQCLQGWDLGIRILNKCPQVLLVHSRHRAQSLLYIVVNLILFQLLIHWV